MRIHKLYDVAISFAAEDRNYAEALANALKRRNIGIFYDKYEKATLWGKNLYTHLSDVYQDQSLYCVMLLSQHYARKVWTNHEREAAQARAFREHKEYILPVRLDDTEISGIPPTICYLRWPPETAETIADAILFKLGKATQPLVKRSLENLSVPLIAAEEQVQRIKWETEEREANKVAEEVQQPPSSQQKLSPTRKKPAEIPVIASQTAASHGRKALRMMWMLGMFSLVLALGSVLFNLMQKPPVEERVPKWRQLEEEVVPSNGPQKPTAEGTLPLTPEPTAGLLKPEVVPEWQRLEQTVVTPTKIEQIKARPRLDKQSRDKQLETAVNAFGAARMSGNYPEAVRLLKPLAEEGNANAQYYLGRAYTWYRDFAEAAKWYRKAAEQGHARAAHSLGLLYESGGPGLSKDLTEAAKWLRKATEQGNEEAKLALERIGER